MKREVGRESGQLRVKELHTRVRLKLRKKTRDEHKRVMGRRDQRKKIKLRKTKRTKSENNTKKKNKTKTK